VDACGIFGRDQQKEQTSRIAVERIERQPARAPPERRHDVDDPGAVGSWVDALDYDVVYPIVALVGDRIAGHTSLHLNTGPSRHRAEVRVFLAKDFRGRGLGTRLLQAIIDLAKRRSLYLLEAEVAAERTSDVRAFQKLGFEAKCTYEDYFMLPDGTFMDAVHLICRLRTGAQEF
jgi:GNAT superfamily N-acetyltransferase